MGLEIGTKPNRDFVTNFADFRNPPFQHYKYR